MLLVSLQIIGAPLWASSSSYSSNYHTYEYWRRAASPFRNITYCCSKTLGKQIKVKKPRPPKIITTTRNEDEDKEYNNNNRPTSSSSSSSSSSCSGGSGVEVPRQKYISVSKSELLDAIISTILPSSSLQDPKEEENEAHQFLSISQCLDLILHAEHKTILEEMRVDYDLITRKSTNKVMRRTTDHDFREESSHIAAAAFTIDKEEEDDNDDEDDISKTDSMFSSDIFTDFKLLWNSANTNNSIIKSTTTTSCRLLPIPSRFQRAFMKLLHSAKFEELSPRDLMLTSALNTDYLLTLPIYVDWKKASQSNTIIFRRGYATERQKGLLIPEKLDHLQSRLLQNLFLLIAKPMGRFGALLNEVSKSITEKEDTEVVLVNKFKIWVKELVFPLKLPQYSIEEQVSDDGVQGGVLDNLLSSDSDHDFPIWEAAQRAVTLYKGILSEVGPRERLLRKFLSWIGLLPSNPTNQVFNHIDSHNSSTTASSETILSTNFLSRISLSDIWKPASSKSCGNDFTKMLRTAVSILFSQSILQEPTFQELILLYTEEVGEGQTEVPSMLQMKIYERIPIPDLPVVFPHKKLSFRILDTVRLDVATIVGLLAYFFSYKFEDILSSPFAIFLDVIPACALVIYVSRVVLGYKQTRDRYQLLVNKTLYEKTIASGFGSIHFLVDASEQQQYKEAILVYAILLKHENGQVTTRALEDECETFIFNSFRKKVKMPVNEAIETLVRLGLVITRDVDGQIVPQAMPCNKAYMILRKRWNSLIN